MSNLSAMREHRRPAPPRAPAPAACTGIALLRWTARRPWLTARCWEGLVTERRVVEHTALRRVAAMPTRAAECVWERVEASDAAMGDIIRHHSSPPCPSCWQLKHCRACC